MNFGTPVDYASFKPEVAAETPTISPQLNLDFGLIDPGVQKTGDLITLKYSNKQWITQPLASRVENVNPFNMVDYVGQVNSFSRSDTLDKKHLLLMVAPDSRLLLVLVEHLFPLALD